MPPVAIVLVDFNGLEDTRRCLDSLSRLNSVADVIVVDNASSINTAASLMPSFPLVHYLRSTVNGGWAGGNNLGLKAALSRGAELVILLNNDTTVEQHFVERLVDAAMRHPEHGILGP